MEQFFKEVEKMKKPELEHVINNYILSGVEVEKPASNATNADRVQWIKEVADQLQAVPYVIEEARVAEFDGKEVGDLVLVSFDDYEAMLNEGDGAEITERQAGEEAEEEEKADDEPEAEEQAEEPAPTEGLEQRLREAVKNQALKYEGRTILNVKNKIISGRRVFELDAGAVSYTVTNDQAAQLL